MQGEYDVQGGVSRRKHLLPFGDFRVRRRLADNRDDERRLGKPPTLLVELLLGRIGMLLLEELGQRRARRNPRIAREDDEPPRRQLAVVGNARSDGEDLIELRFGWRRRAEETGRDRFLRLPGFKC